MHVRSRGPSGGRGGWSRVSARVLLGVYLGEICTLPAELCFHIGSEGDQPRGPQHQRIMRFNLGRVPGGREDLGAGVMDFSHRISRPSRLFQGGVPRPRILPPRHPGGILKVGLFGLQATWGECRKQNQGGGLSAVCPSLESGARASPDQPPRSLLRPRGPSLPCSLRQGGPPAYPRPRCPGCSPPIPPRGLSCLLPAQAPTPQLLPKVASVGPLGGSGPATSPASLQTPLWSLHLDESCLAGAPGGKALGPLLCTPAPQPWLRGGSAVRVGC